jgi:NitT/TauT family transport system substrate-binding protein
LYNLKKATASDVAALAGKTVYANGQAANPEYVLNYLLRQNGLEPGVDVAVEYGDASELASKMAAGELELCMLPVPMSTTVLVKNPDVRVALNLGDEWRKVSQDSILAQGGIVVRSDIENVDAVVESF